MSLEELNILKFGLNHSLPPLKLRKTDVFVSFEMVHRFLREYLKNDADKPALKAQLSHLANSYIHNYQLSRSTLTKHRILKKLRNDKEIVILRPDKGSGVVVLNRRDYEKSIKNLINDKTKFKELSEDVTIKRESKLQRFLRKFKNNKCLDDVEYEKIYPSGSCPAKIYGSPKVHKPFDSNSLSNFRPIVSSIGTYNYNLSKYLCELLSPNLPNEFCTKDTFTFVEELKEVSINDKFLVSYDVNSLFTNIPLKETIKLAVDLIKTSYPNLKISIDNLTKLLKFATYETHFLFNGKFYDQIDGVAMGSPLAPVLPNLFMGHKEKRWIENFQGTPPSYYRRYVDDIFSVFNNTSNFLDVLIDNSQNILKTSTYHKSTYSGLLLNYTSFTSRFYKIGLVKCLIDRAYKINNTWPGFHDDVSKIKDVLKRNSYPPFILDKIIKAYIDKIHYKLHYF